MQWFRGGLVFKAHRLCASLYSRLASNQEEEEEKLLVPPPPPPDLIAGIIDDAVGCLVINAIDGAGIFLMLTIIAFLLHLPFLHIYPFFFFITLQPRVE